jgi:hypothetical protein
VRRRLAIALPLALIASASAGVAVADQQVTANIYTQGGGKPLPEFIPIAALEASCPTYAGPEGDFRGPDGGPGGLPSGATWSLAAVLGCMSPPIHLGAVQDVVPYGTNGPETGSGVLTRADLQSPSDFADPSENPVVFSDGDNVYYQRPPRYSGDNPQGDWVVDTNPAPFVVDVFEGQPLTISVSASQTSPPSGTSVAFTAKVSGANGGDKLSYNWTFDDGSTSSVASPQHTFTTGQYTVTLEVADTTTGGGGGASVGLTVGNPQQGPTGPGGTQSTTTPTTTTTPQPPPPGGHQGGTPNGQHSLHGTTGGNSGSDQHHGSGARSSSRSRSHHRTRSSSQSPSGSPSTGSSPAGSGSSAVASAPYTPPATPAAKHQPTSPNHAPATQSRPAPPAPSSGARPTPVSGLLISGLAPVALSASSLAHSAGATSSATRSALARETRSTSPLAGVIAALLAVLLLSLGARHELRGRRKPRALQFAN